MYKKTIKEAFNQNKLAIFVGAGVSKNSGLPDWGELIEDLRKDLKIQETDFLKVAQLYYLAVGEVTYLQNIKSYFDTKAEPNAIHNYIFELKPKYIITTNWDSLLEDYNNKIFNKYKVISSDKDLVSSNIDKMIIKMHGDFNSEKFVFKEDDYINYSKDYPLIENFIKSILSTHTILFIGYSYSDINIKYIAKWIQNSSKLQPPMFYLSFEENRHYKKYMQNYKIETIVIPEYGKKDNYSYRLENFLKELIEYIKGESLDIDVKDIDLKRVDNVKEILNFIYKKIQVLKGQNYILRDQISELLRECNFYYFNKNVFLYFYRDELTYDYNNKSENLRYIYKYFITLLEDYKNIIKSLDYENVKNIEKKINQIIEIFLHSNIDGISLTKYLHNRFIKKCSKDLFYLYKNLLQDNYQLLESENSIIKLQYNIFCLYHMEEYEKAFNLNKNLISRCFENNDYINLLFAYFNHNQLIDKLRDISKDGLSNFEKYNIEEKFYELPVEIRNQLKTLKRFLTMEFINNLSIEIDYKFQKKKQQEEVVKNRKGLYLGDIDKFSKDIDRFLEDRDRFYAYQKELVLFYLQNMLFFDKNFIYREINKKLCEIELICGLTSREIRFNKYQLYAYIHFISLKDFKELFSRFINDEMLKNKLIIDLELQNWLFKLIKNNYKLFKNSKTSLTFNKNDELLNIIFLFSIIKIDKKINDKLVNEFIKMIEEYNGNLDLYESIREFFNLQKHLNNLVITKDTINKFYTIIIEKLLKYFDWKEVNAWFYDAFEYGYFDISYMIDEEIFENKKIIEKFINKISDFQIDIQLQIAIVFLFGLYKISERDIKNLLKEYFISLSNNKVGSFDMKIHLYLLLISNKILDLNKDKLKNILKGYYYHLINDSYDEDRFRILALYSRAFKATLKTLIETYQIKDKDILEIIHKIEKMR